MAFAVEKDYLCGYCGLRFKAWAKSTGGGKAENFTGINCQSNCITCPKCTNNLPTWEDKEERIYHQLKQ